MIRSEGSTLEALVAANREEILRIAAHHGAVNVRLFGSVARGDSTADSDVDLLIDEGESPTPWFPGGLIADLEDLLGRPIDVVFADSLRPGLRTAVLREARPL